MLDNLPNELIGLVLSHIDAKDLSAVARTCRRFDALAPFYDTNVLFRYGYDSADSFPLCRVSTKLRLRLSLSRPSPAEPCLNSQSVNTMCTLQEWKSST